MNYVIRNRATGQLHRVLSGAVVATYPTREEAEATAVNLSMQAIPLNGGIYDEQGTLYEAIPDPRADIGREMYEKARSGDANGFADTLVKLLHL